MPDANSNDGLLFKTLVDLIKHLDERIESNQRFFLAAIAAIIPLFIFIAAENINGVVFFLFGILLIPLIILFASTSRKLTLTKLFWSKFTRTIERRLFENHEGPFVRQEKDFKEPDNIGKIDKMLIAFGTRHFHHLALVVYVFTIVLALLFIFVLSGL